MPPKTSHSQSPAQEKADKRPRICSPSLSSARHVLQSVARTWSSSNDRYLRRKKREQMHEMMALQEMRMVQSESGDGHKEEQDKTMDSVVTLQRQTEQLTAARRRSTSMDVEEHQNMDDDGRTNETSSINMDNENCTIQTNSVNMDDDGRTIDNSGRAANDDDTLELLSPDWRASMRSPIETIMRQTMHETVAIDPNLDKSAGTVAMSVQGTKLVPRGIAQSSSSASTRKRMISFSPDCSPRVEDQALALKKLEKNIKTNEKLQQRLKAPTPVKSPALLRTSSPAAAVASQARRSMSFTSPLARRPMTFQSPLRRQVATFTSPLAQRPVFQSPRTAVSSCSHSVSRTEEIDYKRTQEDRKEDVDVSLVEALVPDPSLASNDVVVKEEVVSTVASEQDCTAEDEDAVLVHSQHEVGFSQESVRVMSDTLTPLSQESCESNAFQAEPDTTSAESNTSSSAFTSTSVIGDVGLFNCETDVEYTGGVYGEGTDGKVTAAVINGQKIALKRAKPHDGFPEHEAKRRAALELHYLRRVRHMKGFLRCLGLCDAIEHTCIALEVMDCKLSDYLRRYGVNSGGSKHRRYTLSFDDTKAMLKQICLPMITLHEDINIAHGDLACRNILMRTPPEGYEQSWEPDIKLSDFGRIKLPSDEPKILDSSFSFHKNCDVGAFGREILYRLLVGEIVPKECVETRSLHKLLQDVIVMQVPDAAKARLGPYLSLFMRCTAWGVRPTFRRIYEHLDDLEHFDTTENGLFPLKPTGNTDATFMSPVAEGMRHKTTASGTSRAYKRDTPTGSGHRLLGPKSRVSSSRSCIEASAPCANKPVNWLKTRSVVVQRTLAQQELTPIAPPVLIKKRKKTPPSAGTGASRRSLQILNQIQHRTTEKGRKST
uniref:Protein kinase domain-containing protein n=1 Tax=Hyaloperonospora arabidopsidis (strain Emoy2) TaxID=559515 RepID=M4BB91_HYAAE